MAGNEQSVGLHVSEVGCEGLPRVAERMEDPGIAGR
jgi:hypothetical protein